ncbi:hypothetical protein JCM24511_03927 [Saitozyma sp. JCM 24511]|nr:hypothetical protein JCM24511_03927 [Saitozyma sp. JCM 24511]
MTSSGSVLVAGFVLRLALFATSIPALLEKRPELSTPLTSVRSLKEGQFIFAQGSDPYAGGVFHHQSPLYLLLPAVPLVYALADAVAAATLCRIAKERKALVAAVGLMRSYLFNPYALLSCLARSTTTIDNAVLLAAIGAAGPLGGAMLAVASHLSLYPVLLVAPFAVRSRWSLLAFAVSFLCMTALNTVIFGHSWMRASWGVILTVSDLTPNVGMWWYFFTEMFEHFRSFFLGVFQLHNVIYVVPLCLRLEPHIAILVLVGVFSTWKSYPTLGDAAAWAGLLSCYPDVVQNLRHPLFTLTVYLYTFILLPLLHSLWLLTGTGNANFFYAATMVHGLNSSLAVVDVMGAALRRDVKNKAKVLGEGESVQFTRA